jgi:hypothetical protein
VGSETIRGVKRLGFKERIPYREVKTAPGWRKEEEKKECTKPRI